MIWNRILDSSRSTSVLRVLSVVLIIFSVYGQTYLLFWVGLIIGLSSFSSTAYLKAITKKFYYANPKNTIRMFPEDETEWKPAMKNYSRLPIFNSKVRFLVNNEVEFTNIQPTEERKTANDYQFPLSFFPHEENDITFKVKGVKRGVARVTSMEVTLFDLLGLSSFKLINDRLVQTEFIVYPTLLPVTGVNDLIQFQQGARPTPTSLYEDHTLVVGTRDYQAGDSFQRIHWKASARMQEMQTKLYEKTVNQSWTILLNVIMDPEEVSQIGEAELLEKQISHAAFLCQYAVQHHIPFEIFVNIKTRGRLPFMHLEMGEGKSHLIKALELLARLNINSIKMPMFRVLALFDRQQVDSNVVILLGDDQTDSAHYDKWIRQGVNLHKVSIDHDTATLNQYAVRRSIS